MPVSASPIDSAHTSDYANDDAAPVSLDSLSQSDSATVVGPRELTLVPISPNEVKRYETKQLIPKRPSGTSVYIPALTRNWPRLEECGDWTQYAHPEGAAYFMHGKKNIFTDANLHDDRHLRAIIRAIESLESLLISQNVDISGDLEVVLDLTPGDSDEDFPECGYYIADNTKRSIFWLHEYDAEELVDEFQAESKLSQMGLRLEVEYWKHYELFPCHREVTSEILQELKGIMVYNGVDSLTASDSTSSYNGREIQELMAMVQPLREIGSRGGYSAQIVGRLMGTFTHTRFINYYGQYGARLSATQSIFEDTTDSQDQLLSSKILSRTRSVLFHILSIMLFDGPRQHAAALEEVWVDRIMRCTPWQKHIAKVQKEWKNVAALSSILLVIEAVLLHGREETARSLADEALLFAASFSTASLITAVLLLHQLRALDECNAEAVQQYLWTKPGGLRGLGVAYSLPYAFSAWAITAFVASMVCASIDLNPEVPADSVAVRVAAAVLWGCALLAVIWVLLMSARGSDAIGCVSAKLEDAGEWARGALQKVVLWRAAQQEGEKEEVLIKDLV
ncbi:hypothetical protein NEOLEDRAFT_1181199 [Neolentinus lepideus HHB14362 ss-1]|uniref:WW domain-containing protein n=1 Tax=Neolentinus lepideus HHB14362 ss-1 TaxID=1314782 RepID=A0A165QAP5_9AGAM|nr:hypothetical protein NEOLEDRAFT_1181199 [Neolentinus lepideus HHB14362 ss-1]